MSAPPVLLASAVSGRLFERAAAEARRRFPDAPLVALVHWRAAGALPDDVRPYVATDYRDRPAALVRELRRLRPVATVVVCDGAPGASALKARSLAANERGEDADIVRALVRLLEELDDWRAREVYIDGFHNILAQPEFAESERSREMLRLFEDHTRLADILPLGLGDGEVHVAIGREHRLEPLRDCSLIVGRYGTGGEVVGFVGVLGPTRMDYARSIGAVRFVGSLMSDLVRVMEGQ